MGIAVERDDAVLVADSHNHRVVRWRAGARVGEVVADGFGVGYMCNKNSVAATVTSRHLGAAAFGAELERALIDMRTLAVEANCASAKL